jgi:GNAT superfamily N-acetyltransferase
VSFSSTEHPRGPRVTTTSRRNLCPVTGLDLREEPYDGPSGQTLTAQVQEEYVARYGGPDDTPVDAAEFAPPRGRFVIGYVGLEPVAMGGFRSLEDGTVEIKRMFVVPSHRGRGLSRLLLARLEQLAAAAGADRVVLETGMKQPEAMALYASAGYDRIGNFGHYRDSALSASYGKSLSQRP